MYGISVRISMWSTFTDRNMFSLSAVILREFALYSFLTAALAVSMVKDLPVSASSRSMIPMSVSYSSRGSVIDNAIMS